MKKFFSFLISFVIIWALVAMGCYLIGKLDETSSFTSLRTVIRTGLSGAVGGTFGPPLWEYISGLLRRKKNCG